MIGQEDNVILNWLSNVDYAEQQNDFFSRRHPITGQWFFGSREFQAWTGGNSQTLFCPGIPGAGKTIMSSIVINYLMEKTREDNTIIVAYIYCDYKQYGAQETKDLLANLLKQISQNIDPLPDKLRMLYNRHKDTRTKPSADEILETLHSAVAAHTQVFVVVDALDECQAPDSRAAKLISALFDLQARAGINILATSRFIPEITEKFSDCSMLEISACAQDIQIYLMSRMSELPAFVRRDIKIQNEITIGIIKAAGGMYVDSFAHWLGLTLIRFLLAQLHLDSLRGKASRKTLRTALSKLASGSGAYDHAYRNAMKRIEDQLPDQAQLAKDTLSWIICAKRPLKATELQHALGVELGARDFDLENCPDVEDFLSVCAGLVTYVKQSQIIRLVHHTTQEYFERTQQRWFPNANSDLARKCVTYLSLDRFDIGHRIPHAELLDRLRLYPLYHYASTHWGDHVSSDSAGDDELFLKFLTNEAQLSISAYTKEKAHLTSTHSLDEESFIELKPDHHRCEKHRNGPISRATTGLHLAAIFGLEHLTTLLLEKKQDPNRIDTQLMTPLLHAAKKGHKSIVRILLDHGAYIDARDQYGQTGVLLAAHKGHRDVVTLLQNRGATIDSWPDGRGETPLWWAMRYGDGASPEAFRELLRMRKLYFNPDSDNPENLDYKRAGLYLIMKILAMDE